MKNLNDKNDMSLKDVIQCSASESSSFVGIANIPNQVHRHYTKKGLQYNMLLVGESGSGKLTFINALLGLLETNAFPTHDLINSNLRLELSLHGSACSGNEVFEKLQCTYGDVSLEQYSFEFMEKSMPIKLGIVNTIGFGDSIVTMANPSIILDYIDQQKIMYAKDELKPDRHYPPDDSRIHICLYFLPSTIQHLRRIDILTMRCLSEKTHLLPIITKGEILTEKELSALKSSILKDMKRFNIKFLDIPIDHNMSDDFSKRCQQIKDSIPFSIVSSQQDVTLSDGKKSKGRVYPWGIVEIEDERVSDFPKLRSVLVRTHLHHIISSFHDLYYEPFRSLYLIQMIKKDGASFPFLWIDSPLQLESHFHNEEALLRKSYLSIEQMKQSQLMELNDQIRNAKQENEGKIRELSSSIEMTKTKIQTLLVK